MEPANVLRTFAELTKASRETPTSVVGAENQLGWTRYSTRGAFEGKLVSAGGLYGNHGGGWSVGNSSAKLERIIAAGALHSNEQLLRLGWVWFVGTVEVDGTPTRYCTPVLSIGVSPPADNIIRTAGRALDGFTSGSVTAVEAVGDAEISPLIEDSGLRSDLLTTFNFEKEYLKDNLNDIGTEYLGPPDGVLSRLPSMIEWVDKAAAGMGLTIAEWNLPDADYKLYARSAQPGIAVVVGMGLYLNQAPVMGTRRGTLLNLATLPKLESTAFAKLYGSGDLESDSPAEVIPIRPMSRRQRGIASGVGSDDIGLVSGAPGTGKTHLLAALALNAVARGESVLVVGSSPFSVDVLIEHFAATPGPTPVAFGGSRHGQRLSIELSELISQHEVGEGSPTRGAKDFDDRVSSAQRLLTLEAEAIALQRDPSRHLDAVDALDRASDLRQLEEIARKYFKRSLFGFGKARKKAQLESRLDVVLAGDEHDEALVQGALESLKTKRDAQRFLAGGGLSLSDNLSDVASLESGSAQAHGQIITKAWLDGLGSKERRTLAEIANAVGSNRSVRHRALAAIEPKRLVKAAPLWVGAIRDVDDVLPAVAGMFDLVIVDEASQVNQLNAASALVRAKRAIVCGDPNQLGHVSFISNEKLEEAAEIFGTDAARLNARTHSAYDVAAAAVPARVLDEHFRSAPHLIEFSARRFYGGTLKAATRHPSNEDADHIHVEVVEGGRDGDSKKVNQLEVERCLQLLERYMADGCDSIGLVSPFRAQADALEEAILDRYRLEEIERYGLRVGTVHGFQGDERKVMIASWAVGTDEPESAWRFVNQQNLFNVMVTRAKDEMVVVTSNPKPPGLAGEYIRWSEPLENLVPDVPSDNPWINKVASALRDFGVPVRVGYQTGHHIVDIVIGEGAESVAIECVPHSDGAEAHLDRALMLRRAGWRTADAYASKWKDDVGTCAIELARLVKPN